MTSDSVWQTTKAIYTALNGDGVLMGLVTGVYDYVPEDTAFPYVAIGNVASSDWSTATTLGRKIDITINVFSRSRGSKNCLAIMSRIHEVIHNTNPPLTGHTLINLRFITSTILQKRDGLTYHGIMKFRAMTEEI